jgi:hypothetical protein
MAERENLSKLSTLALRNRREGLTKLLPRLREVLRGSLMERYLTCGKPDCKCAPRGAAWAGVVFERQLGPSAPHR